MHKPNWVAQLFAVFAKCFGHIDAAIRSMRLGRITQKQKTRTNLTVSVPGEFESDWTIPSPRNAQKQRIFVGADPNDISFRVLPYMTKMSYQTTERWHHTIRTPVHSIHKDR